MTNLPTLLVLLHPNSISQRHALHFEVHPQVAEGTAGSNGATLRNDVEIRFPGRGVAVGLEAHRKVRLQRDARGGDDHSKRAGECRCRRIRHLQQHVVAVVGPVVEGTGLGDSRLRGDVVPDRLPDDVSLDG